mmetsp:Transcript_5554/g.9304  ORF Transcript_5554/g.9304 Transcript_5554/m.9304 type:complete len:111 (+) Transcript_5554:53-385(+)
MRIIAAYLLAVLGGNKNPSAADINKILSSVGIEADAKKVDLLISSLKDKNLNDLIEEGNKKLAAVPSGGGGGAAAASGGAAAGGAAPAEAAKEEEEEEESDEEMGFDLFD